MQTGTSYVKAFESYCLTDRNVTHGHIHSIRRSQKPHATCKSEGSICYRTTVMGDQSLHCRDRQQTLTLIRWPSYTNLTRMPGAIPDVQINFLRQGFQKLSSDRQTYIQTDRIDGNYKPHHFASAQ